MKHSGPFSRCHGMPRNYYGQVTSRLVRCKGCGYEQRGSALRCPKCGDYLLLADLRIVGEINTPLRVNNAKIRRSSALAKILA